MAKEQPSKHSCPILKSVTAETVIFATGSFPKASIPSIFEPHIVYAPKGKVIREINLDAALNPKELERMIKPTDAVAVCSIMMI